MRKLRFREEAVPGRGFKVNRVELERTPRLLLEPFLPLPLFMLRKAKHGDPGQAKSQYSP